MNTTHLVIPDLFLPADVAAGVCRDLRLPALEKILARGASTSSSPSTGSGRAVSVGGSGPSTGSGRTGEGMGLENHLCELFGAGCEADAPVAPVSAAFDGLPAGCWLRADPVHLHLDQSRMLLSAVLPTHDEAAVLCAGLNEYFAGQGMAFFAPHPQRWYVRTAVLPRIRTLPLSQVIGGNVRGALPAGEDAGRWHGVFNEIQMLLHAHPINEDRAARGELAINSVWLWGGGCSGDAAPQQTYDSASSDDVLAEMFAAAAGIPFAGWADKWHEAPGRQLLVWTGLSAALQRGDLAGWCAALEDFEAGYAQPLWQALRAGKIAQLKVEVPHTDGVRRWQLGRADTWAFWRRARPFAQVV